MATMEGWGSLDNKVNRVIFVDCFWQFTNTGELIAISAYAQFLLILTIPTFLLAMASLQAWCYFRRGYTLGDRRTTLRKYSFRRKLSQVWYVFLIIFTSIMGLMAYFVIVDSIHDLWMQIGLDIKDFNNSTYTTAISIATILVFVMPQLLATCYLFAKSNRISVPACGSLSWSSLIGSFNTF